MKIIHQSGQVALAFDFFSWVKDEDDDDGIKTMAFDLDFL